MSKLETPMIVAYWERVGGTLIEEFLAVRGAPDRGRRLIDAVILPGGENRRLVGRERLVDVTGQDVIVVQAKASRIGMYLLGQSYFSRLLVERLGPESVRSVALCTEDDAVLRPLAEGHRIEVVVMGEFSARVPGPRPGRTPSTR